MRRAPATLVLVGISIGLVQPLVVLPVESPLPPCCRRDGRHGCARMLEIREQAATLRAPDSGLTLRSGDPLCSRYPSDDAVPMAARTIAIAPPRFASLAPVAGLVLPVDPIDAHVPIVQSPPWQERGPPVSMNIPLV